MAQRERRRRVTKYVIFAMPEARTPGQRNLFYAADGTPTASLDRAATFFTFRSAEDFVREKGIRLDGAMKYIAPPMHFHE
ncbi:MAG: hypothetical protein HYS14_09030 [Candidatus Rokubacteria bacterium]|nr:hypothetical protein [Candidatus Rokubacteria bacterium]